MWNKVLKSALFLLIIVFLSAEAQQTVAKPEVSTRETEVTKEIKNEATRKANEPASRFVPSEKLRADDAISFPTDI